MSAELPSSVTAASAHAATETSTVPSPEETIPSFTQEQELAFAQHVQEVWDHGDALNIPILEAKTLGSSELGAAALLMPAGMVAGSGLGGTVIGLVAAGLGLGISAWRHSYRDMPKSTQRIGTDVQTAIGERYNLFLMPERKGPEAEPAHLALRYFGPALNGDESPEEAALTLPQRIRRIAKLAEDNGATEFILEHWFVRDLTNETIPLNSMGDVLTRRGIHLDEPHFSTEWVASASPRFWQEVTERTINRRNPGQEKPVELEWLVKRLRALSPDHPLVAAHDGFQKDPNLQQKAMHRIVRAAIQREFSETESTRPSRQEKALGADPRPKRQAITADISPTTPTREWRINEKGKGEFVVHAVPESDGQFRLIWTDDQGRGTKEATLPALLDMTPKQMKAFLEDANVPPHKKKTLLLTLIGEVLRVNKSSVQEKEVITNKERVTVPATSANVATTFALLLPTAVSTDPFSARKVRIGLMQKWLGRKMAAGALCLATLATASWLTSDRLEDNYNQELQTAKVQISQELGLDPEGNDISLQDLRDRAYQNSSIAKVWGGWRDKMEWLDDILDFSKDSNNGGGGSTSNAASTAHSAISTGDFRDKDEKPPVTEWNLKTTGNISAVGYWTAATSHLISMSERGVGWQRTDWTEASTYYYWTIQKELDDSLPNIKVTRPLVEKDFIGEKGYIRIPIRENTQIAAANIGGQQVQVGKLEDGTLFIIAGNLPKQGTLEYWLIEDETAAKPHAYRPITPLSAERQFDTESIQAVWEEFIPGFTDKTPLEQEALMRAYIKDHFYYERDPFPNNANRDARNPADYIRRTIKEEDADCSVSNGSVALTYLTNASIYEMHKEAVINPADGYLNKKDVGEKVLTSRELHMWNVDTRGTILDSTPHKKRPKVEVAQPPEDDLLPWLLGANAIVLALAAAATADPRRPKEEWENLKMKLNGAKRAERRLLKTDPVKLAIALEVANTVLYDKETRRDIKAAVSRAKATGASSTPAADNDAEMDAYAPADKAVEQLLRNDLRSDNTQVALRQHRKGAQTIREKLVIMRTARILRRVAKVGDAYDRPFIR